MHTRPSFTLGDMIENNAQRFPDDTAFVFQDKRPTHREFAARARRLGSAWYRRGARRQDRIGILAMNCLEFCEVYGASELAGFITATVNYRLAPPEMAFIIADSAPRILVFEKQYAEVIGALRPQLKSVETYVCIGAAPDWAENYEAVVASGDPAGAPIRSTEEDLSALVYTSGTTGRPKGCMRGQREDVCGAEILGSDMLCTPADRFLLMMPLFHIGAKILQMAQHWRAGTVVLHRNFDPELILETIEAERITVAHMAPTMIQTLLESPSIGKRDVSSLRMIVYAAAPMPTPVLRHGLQVFGNVFQQQYGQTEGPGTTLLCHQHRPDGTPEDIRRLGSVGQASPSVQIRIVGEDDVDCRAGEPGEILIHSGAMMRGYWNNSAATIETLRNGWVHTGDVGKLDEDGFLYLVDRKKDMIISGGENIYSREVEEALVQHPAVSESAVIGVADEKWGESVRAIIVLRRGQIASADELIAHCLTLIASYKKPRSIIFVEELPKLPSGKVNKVALRQNHGHAG